MPLISLNLTAPEREQPSLKAETRSVVPAATAETRAVPSLDNPAAPLTSNAAWQYQVFGAEPTAAGVPINTDTAIQSTTVFSCVNVIASDVASLPLKTYEQFEGGTRPAKDTDLYYLLAVEPNPEMTSATFIACVAACAVLTGNGYAEIQRDALGRPVALWPRHPNKTKPIRLSNGDLAFELTDTGSQRIVANANMLHIPGMSLDAYGGGISPIQAARQTIGLHKAAELSSARLFGNGSKPSGILTTPPGLTDDQRANAKAAWDGSMGGERQGGTAVMPTGFAWSQISISPEDMQFLGTMGYTAARIAGLFRVPAHMIGDTSKASNNNMETMGQEYVTYCLRPWLTRWELEVHRKLMPTMGRNAGLYSVRFDYSELVKGNFESQTAGYASGLQWGYLSQNDVRMARGQNPIANGDVYRVPMNMVNSAYDPADNTSSDLDVMASQSPAPNSSVTAPLPGTQRNLLAQMNTTYSALFRDALGRVMTREKRDSDAISRCFAPVLQTIADEASRYAGISLNLTEGQTPPTDKVVRDVLKALEKRAAEWTPATLDADATADIQRSVKAIVLNVYREYATAIVLPPAA